MSDQPKPTAAEYECKVCGNTPDEHGHLEHGRGCYTQSEDGGGSEYIEEADQGKSQPTAADHPADDAEPVAEGWLRSIGFEEIDCPRHGCRNAFSDKCRHVIFSPHWHRDFVGQWFVNGIMCQEKKTRGDVRRLCAALGIKLAEGDG